MIVKRTSVLAALIFLISLTACAARSESLKAPTNTPKPPINLELKDLQGNHVQLQDMRGEVVLLNYWASWCSPCREEMPILNAFYKAHQSKDFVLIAVNVSESATDAADFIKENGYVFPVWSDPTGNTMIELGINGLPASILIDPDGRIHKVWLGPLTQEMLEDTVLPLLQN